MPFDERGGFSTLNGPSFHRPGDGEMAEQAFYAIERHANGLGLVHGGMLSAFMDGVLAGAVWRGVGKTAVTIHLSIDFLHMARVGEWIMGEAATTSTKDVAFAEGRCLTWSKCDGPLLCIPKLMNRDR